jgi:hypothetical protein
MKRQLLAGRFGPDDHIEIPAAADEQLIKGPVKDPGVAEDRDVN